jgi:hypothetical protein
LLRLVESKSVVNYCRKGLKTALSAKYLSLQKAERIVAKKAKKPSIFDDHDGDLEEDKLKLKPESVVGIIADEGKLPSDWCPYGDGYMPEKPKFLGDTEPFPHMDGTVRQWEVINDGDPDLNAIYFSLPSPPKDLNRVDNYGLDRDEQYFRRFEVPKKLQILEKKSLENLYEIQRKNRQEAIQGYKIYLEYWRLFEDEAENLQDEIEWLKSVWWHRKYGYWFYNDGELTFLPPDYFDFLNFYYIDEAQTYPEYRDDVRRKFCFSWYLENATETFAHIDPESGRAMKGDDGKYEMIDLGRRVFFGDCEPKTRRTGATHEAVHKILKESTTRRSYFSTIISFEGNNAEIHYKKKLLPAFDKLPMCLKPMWEGSRRPNVLRLDAPPNVYHIKGLGSAVSFSDSGGLFKNEGDRLNGLLNDEQGKDSQQHVNIFERWNINKLTMATGMGINILDGVYVKNPSTVEQMESSSAPYYKMCMMSDFYKRIPHKGQTASGFARIFLPAYQRMEGFIDRFGKSVIDAPTERQIRLSPDAIFAKSKKGARQMFQAERDALLAENTPQSLEAYRSVRRKSPFAWAECWLGTSGSVGYNLEIVDKRLGEINRLKSFGKAPYKVGYFYREHGRPDDRVLWKTDPDVPKFKMSMDIDPRLTNQREMTEVWDGLTMKWIPSWRPLHGYRFTCGVDPFRNLKANEAKLSTRMGSNLSNSRQSDGGIAILWEYDEERDKGKPKIEWESFKCILSYRYRPATQEEYFEDVIMACQYYGAMMYPEQNVEAFISHVLKRGYGGYFLYDIGLDGKQKPLPGRYTGTEVQQEMIREYKDYITFRGHVENHDDLLNEIKMFKGLEDFTTKDLKVAFGYALLGSKSRYREILTNSSGDAVDLSGFNLFRKRRF